MQKGLLALFCAIILAFGLHAEEFNKMATGEPELIQKGDEKAYCPICGMSLKQFYKTSHDVNGNPRYVLHFLALADTYEEALFIGKKAFGKKFHNKQFGGGIVFQTYSLSNVCDRLNKLLDESKA